MRDKSKITSEAKGFIADLLDLSPETIPADKDLKGIGLDSFRIIELVLFLERRTGLPFPDHDYTPDNLKSLDSLVNCFLKSRL